MLARSAAISRAATHAVSSAVSSTSTSAVLIARNNHSYSNMRSLAPSATAAGTALKAHSAALSPALTPVASSLTACASRTPRSGFAAASESSPSLPTFGPVAFCNISASASVSASSAAPAATTGSVTSSSSDSSASHAQSQCLSRSLPQSQTNASKASQARKAWFWGLLGNGKATTAASADASAAAAATTTDAANNAATAAVGVGVSNSASPSGGATFFFDTVRATPPLADSAAAAAADSSDAAAFASFPGSTALDSAASDLLLTLSSPLPIAAAQRFLLSLHSATGLPWYLSLALAAFVFRLAVVPVAAFQLRAAARVARFRAPLAKTRGLYQALLALPPDSVAIPRPGKAKAAQAALRVLRVYAKMHRVSVLRLLAPMCVSIPLFVTFNQACRRLLAIANDNNTAHPSLSGGSNGNAANTAYNAKDAFTGVNSASLSNNAASLSASSSEATVSGLVSATADSAAAASSGAASLTNFADSATAALIHGLRTEGPWFAPDLTVPDETMVLPLLALAATLVNINVSFHRFAPSPTDPNNNNNTASASSNTNNATARVTSSGVGAPAHSSSDNSSSSSSASGGNGVNRAGLSPMAAKLSTTLQVCAVAATPLLLHLPASLFLYWIVAMSTAATQSLVVKLPGVRRLAGFERPPFAAAAVALPPLQAGAGAAPAAGPVAPFPVSLAHLNASSNSSTGGADASAVNRGVNAKTGAGNGTGKGQRRVLPALPVELLEHAARTVLKQ